MRELLAFFTLRLRELEEDSLDEDDDEEEDEDEESDDEDDANPVGSVQG